MIVYRMSRFMTGSDSTDPDLPEAEFSAKFNRAGWTPEGTMASSAYASFDDLQAHMNVMFSGFVDDGPASAWKSTMGESPYPLHVFQASGWILEWSDPDFKPLDVLDETDAAGAADKLSKI